MHRDYGLLSALALLALSSACGALPPDACHATVAPGAGDQATLDEALANVPDGGTLCLEPGRFRLSHGLSLSGRRSVTLRGAGASEDGGSVLDFIEQLDGEAGLLVDGVTDLEIADLAIRAPAGHGLSIANSVRVIVRGVSVGWPSGDSRAGSHGVAVVDSSAVRIEASEVFSAAGAAFHLVRATDCVLERDRALGSAAGYVLESSDGCELSHDIAEGNARGIVVWTRPERAVEGTRASIHDSALRDDNLPASEGDVLGFAPQGVGIALLGADDVDVFRSTIEDHRGAGIAILSWPTLEPDASGGELDVHAERIAVHANALDNNGFDPGGAPEDPFTHLLERSGLTELADVVWDGALGGGEVQTLCARDNADATFLDLGARDGFAVISEDASVHDCAQPAP